MARVVVDVMLKPEILDPQGQAVANALPRLGVDEVSSVRIGRRIELQFDGAPDLAKVNQLADRLLANPVIETYTVTVDGRLIEPPAPAPATAEPEAQAEPEAEAEVEPQAEAEPEPEPEAEAEPQTEAEVEVEVGEPS